MKRKPIVTVLLIIFLAIALFSGYMIISTLVEDQQNQQTYTQLQQFVEIPATTAPAATLPADPAQPTEPVPSLPEEDPIVYPVVDFDALHEINPNVVAWIYIEDTHINYPVVQGTDNQYYVKHMIDGTANRAGSIFMDRRNNPDFLDKHTILYGHNMKNDTMFADITNYRDQEYYDSHPMGLIMTPDGNFRFEIIAAHVAKLSGPSWDLEFESDAQALQWAQNAMEKSGFVSRYTPTEKDLYITLSTCSYEFNEARFVLVGVLK